MLIGACSKQLTPKSADESSAELAKDVLPQFVALESRERQADETVWARERLAERCGLALERLWDEVNASTNKLDRIIEFATGEVVLPRTAAPVFGPGGVRVLGPSGPDQTLNSDAWRDWLRNVQAQGWEVSMVEFRHRRFNDSPAGLPEASEFYFFGGLINKKRGERASVEGTLRIKWGALPPGDGPPAILRVDASDVSTCSRQGAVPFLPVLDQPISPRHKSPFIDPFILYDLDGDGRSEIILAGRNIVSRQRDWSNAEVGPLCRVDPGNIHTALVADFDSDGTPDLLTADSDGLRIFGGTANGTFDQPPRSVWKADPKLKFAQVITCGDIDADGDLDLWLAQYKVPYTRGQLPTPYYDANDGYLSYLLVNDGRGNFSDGTVSSGLAAKRFRRTYSASFADLDNDGDLDLVVVSDFSGVDIHLNDGKGHFKDVTRRFVAEPHAAGMAHAWADFNRDGRLDLLVMGMNSPTVDRLDHLKLVRSGVAVDQSKRTALMYGNRLMFSKPEGRFEQSAFDTSLDRSGWSWGCTAADFDNDGFLDVYVANGHETKESVRDYEAEYWLHDLYVGTSSDDPVAVT